MWMALMDMKTTVRLAALEEALMWTSAPAEFDNRVFIDRLTGALHFHTDFDDQTEPLPADIDDETRYASVPGPHDLELGQPLALTFVETHAPQLAGEVRAGFRRKGGWRHFKTLLADAGQLEQWHAYELAAQRRALWEWAEENGFAVAGTAEG